MMLVAITGGAMAELVSAGNKPHLLAHPDKPALCKQVIAYRRANLRDAMATQPCSTQPDSHRNLVIVDAANTPKLLC